MSESVKFQNILLVNLDSTSQGFIHNFGDKKEHRLPKFMTKRLQRVCYNTGIV